MERRGNLEFIREPGFGVRIGQERRSGTGRQQPKNGSRRVTPKEPHTSGRSSRCSPRRGPPACTARSSDLGSYGSIDTLAALQTDETSDYARVWREAIAFFDPDPHADWSRT